MREINIPKFDEFLAPILKYCGDNKEHTLSEVIDEMGSKFQLTPEQVNAMLPNGKRTYIYDRIAWAITYLVHAGLLERTGRSKFKITKNGLSELKTLPEKISYTYLLKFPTFKEFKEEKKRMKNQNIDILSMTPNEQMENIIKNSEESLSENLLDMINKIKPADFEKLVIDLVLALGYGKNYEELAKVIGKPNDQGIDGEISQDKLGFDKIYLQAKRWDINSTVGAKEIRDFIGALTIKHAQKGIFITTASFSKEAYETVEKDTTHKIILINGEQLAKLMIEYKIGVKIVKSYDLKEIDNDYFESF